MHTTNPRLDLELPLHEHVFDEAELAAVAFLARYSGRTVDAYRHDLRSYFTWAADSALQVLAATRPHVELYRHHMEQQGLAASTIDRSAPGLVDF
jgi:site-specific recombinase XerD